MLRHCPSLVDLVAQDDDGHFLELGHFEDPLELIPALLEAALVAGVDQVDNSIDIGDVVAPGLAGSLVASQIPGLEPDFAYINHEIPKTSYSQ